MKKLILILVASFFVFQLADAQLFKYGLKAGVGFSSLSIEEVTGITGTSGAYDLLTGDGVVGYHVGVQTRIKIAMAFVQPEVIFNAGGGTVKKIETNGAEEIMNINFTRVDVPVLVGVKFGPARLGVGPVGSYVISENNDLIDIDPGYEIFTKSMTWGFQAGIGVDLLKKVTLDARYEGSLSKLGNTLDIGSQTFSLDARPKQWVISVGVWF
jgi:opacity protein-like surface antigen